jgi:tRNA (guanine37-N1)-methyltransferase
MRFDIITLFPQIIDTYQEFGMVRKGIQEGLLELHAHDLRQFGLGNYKQVDDRTFGGGSGMLLMFEPMLAALNSVKAEYEKLGITKFKVLATSAKGEKYVQSIANKFAQDFQSKNLEALVILCGRYEGFDQRIIDELIDHEISMGNFVLTGGELPALTIVDSISRLLPGVLGKEESFAHDSFYEDDETIQYPQYTRPEVIEHQGKQLRVPEILLSGDHGKIQKWREEHKISKK